ncbi:MAG: DEAD/DEAH box helicase [Armatimonadota bacterium]|nr:DEAD/DEAH box helicase [Armatimonadota bacterium]MDR7494885.1 DEAD/DEAH box helicase [Armatimonadota bacterium]MDR7500282.1 DEAD/DEAH box helicase [Armatimonadota bacterium]MDR7505569.1 DEAD/DEAH box helicase [Armatimonadota bacterium]MDR7547777.1 DEAD/DEAH box helicase [Armatimonadota bacterium]
MDVRAFLDDLQRQSGYAGQMVHTQFIPPRPARYAVLTPPPAEPLRRALQRRGIRRFYRHQVEAIGAVRSGEHTVVVTGTASGKTLCYTVPVLETLLADPQARALYVFPTKALAQDQADALAELELGVPFATYDGDTPIRRRRELRETAQIILTNPDMLHVGILPQHFRWAAFFRRLRYVVIDDAHVYRGVFGSHVANIIRRLRRICRMHGAAPVFVCTSATIGNPEEFASTLLGLPVRVIADDGSPSGPRWFVLWNPPIIDRARARRRSAYVEGSALFAELVRREVRTIAFTQARKITELVYRYARAALEERAPELADRISPYRAGYLPRERRAIERRLFDGELLGVISTSALELGIDVGGLDAAVLVGYPGTIASTWQRAGRAGRGTDEALVVLIALEDALDQYLMRAPEYLFERTVEQAAIDPENPYILAGHLRCAAAELPVGSRDTELFGPRMLELARLLEGHGDLRNRHDRWYWAGARYPAGDVEVRSAGGEAFRVVEAPGGRLIGTVDGARALEQLHPGAVYLHQGEPYLVGRLDLASRTATVVPAEGDYYTQPRSDTDLEILAVRRQRPWGPTVACFGDVEVRTQVTGFVRKRLFSEEVLGEEPLDLPEERLQTTALWFGIPAGIEEELRRRQLDLAGGIHAVEHAAIGVLPLFAMCDRWDLGGVSYPVYPEMDAPAIFIYEGHPGGVGITEKGYALLDEVMAAALRTIEGCPCEAGCPSCIQSPKCGNLNEPLDKAAAVLILQRLLRPAADRLPPPPAQDAPLPPQAPASILPGGRRAPRHRRHW